MLEFRTPKQIERAARNQAIAQYFREVSAANPDTPAKAIIRGMAAEGRHGLHSELSIRNVLISTGALIVNPRAI